MLDQNSILDAKDVRCNPVHTGKPMPRKSTVDDHKISLGHDRSRFILQRRRAALDEIEEAVPARRDMRAVLNIIRRPEALSRCVVALIEQRVESLQNQSFIFDSVISLICISNSLFVMLVLWFIGISCALFATWSN